MTLLQPAHEPQGAPAACSHNTSRATHLASQSPPAPGASCSSKACGSLPAACAAAKAAFSVLTQDGFTCRNNRLDETLQNLNHLALDLGKGRRRVDDPNSTGLARRLLQVTGAHPLKERFNFRLEAICRRA